MGVITLAILLLSIAMAISYYRRTRRYQALPLHVIRLTNTVMVGLACWAVMVYVGWLLGLPLSVGTIQEGRMAEAYWLPPFALSWAAIGHYLLHVNGRNV